MGLGLGFGSGFKSGSGLGLWLGLGRVSELINELMNDMTMWRASEGHHPSQRTKRIDTVTREVGMKE